VEQDKLIEALMKFGWGSFLSYNITINNQPYILEHTAHKSNHHHHLHLNRGDFQVNYKK